MPESLPRRILIVEDDLRIADMLDNYLKAQGFATLILGNGLQVVPEVQRMEPSLVLLDRMLPGRVQWFDPPQHLFVFSAPGLKMALEQAGFRVIVMDTCYDRTPMRRLIRKVRNGTLAAMLRVGAELGRMKSGTFGFTRYPIGNLQSFVVEKPR